jgi:uncharacterized RDD family membrane protein YckC
MNKNKINVDILRMLAYLVDIAVFILLMIPLVCVIASFIPSNLADYTYIQYSLFAVIFGGYVVYYLVSWKSRYQRTLGQLFAGLKLLSAKESELTYRQCILKILILSLPPVLFVGLLILKADSRMEIGRAYLLCIIYCLLPIYLITIWKIDSLIGMYTVKYDEIQKSSYLIRFKRIAAYIIDLLISLQFCAQLFFISFMLWIVLRVTILKNANIACSADCAFVMSCNAFVIAYYLYHFISWKDGYRRTLGQLFLKLKVVNLNAEKHLPPNRSIKTFFLLLPILPFVIFINYCHFFNFSGEGAAYLASILIAWGVITQIICLGFSDEIDDLAGMKITNSNKREIL